MAQWVCSRAAYCMSHRDRICCSAKLTFSFRHDIGHPKNKSIMGKVHYSIKIHRLQSPVPNTSRGKLLMTSNSTSKPSAQQEEDHNSVLPQTHLQLRLHSVVVPELASYHIHSRRNNLFASQHHSHYLTKQVAEESISKVRG